MPKPRSSDLATLRIAPPWPCRFLCGPCQLGSNAVGQRSAGESVAAIIQAFVKQRTWKQADLGRHLELGVPALRKRLVELQAAGMPLRDERETPHVYWSVP